MLEKLFDFKTINLYKVCASFPSAHEVGILIAKIN